MSMGVVVMVMMVVAAMFIMMVMVIIMSVVMRCMIVRRVLLSARFRGRMAATLISPAFGIERRFDVEDPGPQPLQHLGDDVVTPDSQRLGGDLRRQMTIAEVPGEADQMLRIPALDFDQRFGGGNDLDQAAVVEHQRIAAAQRERLLQIEQE